MAPILELVRLICAIETCILDESSKHEMISDVLIVLKCLNMNATVLLWEVGFFAWRKENNLFSDSRFDISDSRISIRGCYNSGDILG